MIAAFPNYAGGTNRILIAQPRFRRPFHRDPWHIHGATDLAFTPLGSHLDVWFVCLTGHLIGSGPWVWFSTHGMDHDAAVAYIENIESFVIGPYQVPATGEAFNYQMRPILDGKLSFDDMETYLAEH